MFDFLRFGALPAFIAYRTAVIYLFQQSCNFAYITPVTVFDYTSFPAADVKMSYDIGILLDSIEVLSAFRNVVEICQQTKIVFCDLTYKISALRYRVDDIALLFAKGFKSQRLTVFCGNVGKYIR